MKNIKNLFINFIILIFSVGFVLLSAEIILRFNCERWGQVWEKGGWVKKPIYRRSKDPHLLYELIPGARAGNLVINSDGFRGPEYTIPKPDETFRIIMLGDSETLSQKLAASETLASQLEALLNKNSSLLDFEVLNFGVDGYSTPQELEQLRTKGLKYDPDLVILNYVLNDVEPRQYYLGNNLLTSNSALARQFAYFIKLSLIKHEKNNLDIHSESETYRYYYQPEYFGPVKKAIEEMSEISRRLGSRLVVVIFPSSGPEVGDFKEGYPYYSLHRLVKGIPADNIVFIELIDAFNRLNLSPQKVSIDYFSGESHKNAQGLKVCAEYIYDMLVKEGVIFVNPAKTGKKANAF